MKPLVSDTGKSIDDYRTIIKQLKIKVKKLQQQNQELEAKVSHFEGLGVSALNSSKINERGGSQFKGTDEDEVRGSFNLNSNEIAILNFQRAAMNVGLTLEMIFRAFDVEGKGSILFDDFRLYLSKLKLGLTPPQITKLLYIFDEDFSGIIKKEDYVLTLAAYGVNTEKVMDGSRTISQAAIINFAKTLKEARISNEEAFRQCDSERTGSVASNNLSEFYKKIRPGVSKKERAALYYYFDYDQKGKIDKHTFIEVLERAQNSISSSNDNEENGPAPTSSINKQGAGRSSKQEQAATISYRDKKSFKDKLKGFIEDFQRQTGKPVTALLESILLNIKNPISGILNSNVADALRTFGKFEEFFVFRALDVSENGTVYYDDLEKFFVENKNSESNYIFFVINTAKKLEALKKDTNTFLKENKFNEGSKANSLDDFSNKISSILKLSKEDGVKIFKAIKPDGNSITGAEFLSAINKFRSDVKQEEVVPQAINYSRTKTLAKMTMSKVESYSHDADKEINQLINELYPNLVPERDYFSLDGKFISTILNSQEACLKRCSEIIAERNKSGKDWDDPDFGPNENDPTGLYSMYFDENNIPPGCPEPDSIEWKRISEIRPEGDACFFDEEGAESNEVMQSSFLGNCWFVSALSIIATQDALLRGNFNPKNKPADEQELTDKDVKNMTSGLYPPIFHYMREYGVFVIRFFKEYKWRYVIIDNKLPVLQSGDLVYGKCRPPADDPVPKEYWVSLIEKAYAKIHNCYQALFSGFIDEGLADMTGYASEKRDIVSAKLQTNEEKDALWTMLVNYLINKSMIGCSANGGTESNIELDGEDTGLKSGHAYAVIDVLEVEDEGCKNYHRSHRLVRVRNPWGFGEWKLKWNEPGDEAGKLTEHIEMIKAKYEKRKKKGQEVEEWDPNAEDGTFLMNYKSWRSLFHNLFISLNFPDEYSGRRIDWKWTEENSGGIPVNKSEEANQQYAINPQFLVDLKKNETNLFVSVGQRDGRLVRGIKYPYKEVINPFNLIMYKLNPGEKRIEKFDQSRIFAHSGKIKISREICIPTTKVKSGQYILIPSCKDAGSQGDFTLNIYFDCIPDNDEQSRPSEIRLACLDRDIDQKDKNFEEIDEEEEDFNKVDPKLKRLLKLK